MKENKPTPTPALENESRRKAVKTIVGGVSVLAAYHIMPVKWGTPIIEQVFLPAHAATSGSSLNDPCTVTHTNGPEDTFLVEGFVTPPTEGLATTIVLTPTPGSPQTTTTTTLADGTFSATITIASGSDRVDVTTTVEGADGTASCFSVRPGEEACENITFNVDNQSLYEITVTYDNCGQSGIVGTVKGDDVQELFSVHPLNTITLALPLNTDVATIDNGDNTQPFTGSTVVNPSEHPNVIIDARGIPE
jgi:hypothetical protein